MTSSALSSRSSGFSDSMLHGGSTAPMSRAPSECVDNTDTVTPEAPGGQVSQLRRLAAVAGTPSAPARTSHVYQSPVQSHLLAGSSSVTSFQGQHTVSRSDPFETSTPALQRTHSFIQLPQHVPEGHTILATDVEASAPQDSENFNGNFMIDETSPSEDERFAESVIRGGK